MQKIKQAIADFFTKYSVLTHTLLAIWNLFVTSWATGISPTIYGVSINARAIVSWLQANAHLPTWTVAAMTLVLNGIVFYNNMKTTAAQKVEAKALVVDDLVKSDRCPVCDRK